jgi:hypothetical protein
MLFFQIFNVALYSSIQRDLALNGNKFIELSQEVKKASIKKMTTTS